MKTGKTHALSTYSQHTDGEAINLANHDQNSNTTREQLGMIRFNTDTSKVELYTMRGWKQILTSDDIVTTPEDSLEDGIIRKVQTAKKNAQVGVYFQGATTHTRSTLVNYKSQVSGLSSGDRIATQPDWMSGFSTGQGIDFYCKLPNEGNDVYLFDVSGNQGVGGTGNYAMNINAPGVLGIPDSEKHRWRYNILTGVNGYAMWIHDGGRDLRISSSAIATHNSPSPDMTPDNDTSINYGQFTCLFKYNFNLNNSAMYKDFNCNFNLLVSAKKFKGF